MTDCRQTWYDAEAKVAVTVADVTAAAQALAQGHLCGPTAAHFLTEALAAAALLGTEWSEPDETLVLQLKCSGPLGGLNVECTREGRLRGYTERKTLDDFDGLGAPDAARVLGESRLQVTRSAPGRLLAQGVSNTLDGYLAGSLQRRAQILLEASVSDEVEILEARGLLVEALPDSDRSVSDLVAALAGPKGKPRRGTLAAAPRALIRHLGLAHAELKEEFPLAFGCRCSPERAAALVAALPPEERARLPRPTTVTCHMCGRTFTLQDP